MKETLWDTSGDNNHRARWVKDSEGKHKEMGDAKEMKAEENKRGGRSRRKEGGEGGSMLFWLLMEGIINLRGGRGAGGMRFRNLHLTDSNLGESFCISKSYIFNVSHFSIWKKGVAPSERERLVDEEKVRHTASSQQRTANDNKIYFNEVVLLFKDAQVFQSPSCFLGHLG